MCQRLLARIAPEATFQFDYSVKKSDATSYSAVAIGPGLTPDDHLERTISDLFELNIPIILDAGALSLREYPHGENAVIITPHPGEFARITGKTSKEVQQNRIQLASKYADDHGVTVVLKGQYTVIAFPDGTGYINTTGNRALSKGGTGDTLTGMLLASVGTHNEIKEAVANAVYIHGACADEWVLQHGEQTMLAHDFNSILPKILRVK